ncbi:MAG: SBBP repeat-containing protein [Phaeodactylibacter xiamenensis]|nr:SBBP repeat-containing protein [Phaeodactylibacter xiamenensis]
MESLRLKLQPISMVLMISIFLSGIPLWAQQSTFYLETWQASKGEQPALSLDRALSTPSRIGGVYTVGSSYNESGGYYDLLVTRYNLGGTIAYQDTFNLPTPGNIIAGAITTNSSLTELFITGTVYNGSANSYDVLTLKYDINGQVDWYSTYNGIGNGYDGGSSLLVDSDTIYVGGAITDTTGLFGALCIKYHDGGTEVWDRTLTPNNRNLAIGTLSKGSPNELMIGVGAEFNNGTHRVGSAVLATSDGSTLSGFSENSQVDLEEITGFAADADQNLYVTGYSDAAGNGDDIVTVMLDDTLGLVWESIYNGSANSDDRPSSLDIDSLDNVYVGGYATGSNGRDFAVIKYNNSGTQQWAALYDGVSHSDDEAKAVVAGKDGLVYATGSVDTLGQKDYHTRILKASDGTTEWSASFNGLHSKDDEATSISLDGEGGLSVLGKNGLSNGSTEYMLVRYAKKQLTIPPGDGAASPALAFTEQRGQLTDTSGTSVEGVRFYSTGSYPPLYVQNDTLSFVTASVDTSSATPDTLHRVDITFFDSKTSLMSAAGLDKLDNYRNYYLGHIPEGRARVGQYGRVAVTDLYDGINLQMFADESGIVYYFVIEPGGDPNDLKLDFHGQDSLYLKARNLFVGTSLGDFNLPAPKAFQIDSLGQEVSTAWKPEYSIAGSRVSFSSTGSYDSTKVLVVELRREEVVSGSLEDDWITYYGGNAQDVGIDIDVSNTGDIYVLTRSSGYYFPGVGQGIDDLSGSNAVVGKFSQEGEEKWSFYWGGDGTEEPAEMVIDDSDQITVVGETSSDNLLSRFPIANNENLNNSWDGFVFRTNSTGDELLWSSYISGSSTLDRALGVAVDGEGSTYIVGHTSSDIEFPIMDNGNSSAYNQDAFSGVNEGYLLKFDKDLEQVWGTYFGGTGREYFSDIEVDPSSNDIYILGGTGTSTAASGTLPCNVPTGSALGAFPDCNPGSVYYDNTIGIDPNGNIKLDLVLVQFSKEGVLKWSTYLGGGEDDYAYFPSAPPGTIIKSGDISIDGDEIAVVCFSNNGSLFSDHTPGTNPTPFFQLTSAGGPLLFRFENKLLSWSSCFSCGTTEGAFNEYSIDLNGGSLYFSLPYTFSSAKSSLKVWKERQKK